MEKSPSSVFGNQTKGAAPVCHLLQPGINKNVWKKACVCAHMLEGREGEGGGEAENLKQTPWSSRRMRA